MRFTTNRQDGLTVARAEREQAAARRPVLLFLHGLGERGADGVRHVSYPFFADDSALPRRAYEHGAVILAPQCPEHATWTGLTQWGDLDLRFTLAPAPTMAAVMNLLGRVLDEPQIDPTRVYVTGLSMGGFATWDLAARRPELFAGVVPVCGGGDPETAIRLRNVRIWAFHGAADPVVPAAHTERMFDALRKAGAGDVACTLYAERGHDAWSAAYRDPVLQAWLLEGGAPDRGR
jgi:predicted peptidase